jgi:hypothetical protein
VTDGVGRAARVDTAGKRYRFELAFLTSVPSLSLETIDQFLQTNSAQKAIPHLKAHPFPAAAPAAAVVAPVCVEAVDAALAVPLSPSSTGAKETPSSGVSPGWIKGAGRPARSERLGITSTSSVITACMHNETLCNVIRLSTANSICLYYLLRTILMYKPKDLNRDWSPRFSTLLDKNGWVRPKTA